jgi:hypothetical protein
MNLSEDEKQQIINFIKQGKPLPKEYIYKLYADDEDVFLFWNGRGETVTNAVLPFHSIEHIDEPRKEVEPQQATLFDTTGRQLKGNYSIRRKQRSKRNVDRKLYFREYLAVI